MFNIDIHSSAGQYTIAWGVYLIAATMLCAAWLRLTWRWQKDIRLLLMALLAVILFVPAPVPGREELAPAMIFIVLSPFTGTPETVAPVLVRLMLAAIAAVVFAIVAAVARHWWRRSH